MFTKKGAVIQIKNIPALLPVCVLSYRYRDGLLIVRQDAAESLQVSFLLPESHLQPPHLALTLLHTAELFINGALQTTEGGGQTMTLLLVSC